MKRLLLVDGDFISGRSYADIFTRAGYQVELTTEGRTTLSALERFTPAAIVINYFLPDLTAAQLLTRIRANPSSKTCPAIVLTAARHPDTIEAAKQAGATKCVVKELAPERELLRVVREAIEQASKPKPANPAPPPEPAPAEPPPPEEEQAEPKPGATPELAPSLSSALEAPQTQANFRKLKNLTVGLLKTTDEMERLGYLEQIKREVEFLASIAPDRKKSLIGIMVHSLRALLQELCDRPESIFASNMRTIFQTVETLTPILERSQFDFQDDPDKFSTLSVDDDVAVQGLLVRALATAGMKIDTVNDPLAAIPLAKQKHWDLFILDVSMPNMTGFELCEKLRAMPKHGKTPVIFLTGCNNVEHRFRFAQLRANDFVAKPFSLPELAVKASSHLLKASLKAAEARRDSSEFFRRFGG